MQNEEEYMLVEDGARLLGVPVGLLRDAGRKGRIEFHKSNRIVERSELYTSPILSITQLAKVLGVPQKALAKAAKAKEFDTYPAKMTGGRSKPDGPRYVPYLAALTWAMSQILPRVGGGCHA